MIPAWAWMVVLAVLLPWVGMIGWVTTGYLRYRQYWAHKGHLSVPMTFSQMLRYQVREVGAFVVIGWWWMRAMFRDGLRQPTSEVEGRPVLCVHGFSQNGTNFWGIRLALAARGRATRAVFMGFPPRPVSGYAPALARAMGELVRDFPDGIDVIAHSMGGTVLRVVLADHPELAAGVRRIITIGSPHEGTAIARGFFKFGPAGTDLARRSAFMNDLPPFSQSAPQALVTCVAARHDWIVYPRQTSLIPGTRQVVVEGVGHVGLLVWQSSIDVVVEALMAPNWVQERANLPISTADRLSAADSATTS